ncbi:RagB/SusD family nutrient uptake outer membrane protein [Chitinophaga arvensicola]|uniref:Starch-binding associating with outer membrane n=1 Tax=Chitinophaga arvensicola TaxID=29529 RepID=A0A1I0RPF5_9BACT|nr:RagB/SusD family nutrient uptake outer membrane protein [Chitinophaga arvensicola]SEW43103.1 Starch-binding associating with outer membrane [Chitinophaga arvensicola]
MNKIYKFLRNGYLLLSVAISISSCKKFVEIDPPLTQLATASVFEEKYTAIAAVTGIYGAMYSMVYFNIYTGLSSDELTSYGYDLYPSLYQNALSAKNGGFLVWSNAYKYIYQANAAIEGLEHSNGIAANIKNQLLGEVRFIRAFWYFNLINLYGDVPLVTTTDYNVITKLPRSAKTDIYAQIINDLKAAQLLLGDGYVDSKNNSTSDRVRPTKWVATALLARAYLFNKDYNDAALQSTAIINNTATFQLNKDLNDVFLKNSTEAIWQLMPGNDALQTPEGSNFILDAVPTAVALSPQLLQAFEPNDERRKNWVDSIVVSGTAYYYPFKYKVKYGSSDLTEYSMVLRLAEQYLIRSEARIQLNDLRGGTADLDTIRTRAGLPGTTATTKADLLKAILHERQVELFTEGHRWIDLKKEALIDQVMTKVTPEKGGGKWQSYQQLYPIPTEDIQHSSNLKQNPGY